MDMLSTGRRLRHAPRSTSLPNAQAIEQRTAGEKKPPPPPPFHDELTRLQGLLDPISPECAGVEHLVRLLRCSGETANHPFADKVLMAITWLAERGEALPEPVSRLDTWPSVDIGALRHLLAPLKADIQRCLAHQLNPPDPSPEHLSPLDTAWRSDTRTRHQCQALALALLTLDGRFNPAAITPITVLLGDDTACPCVPWTLRDRWLCLAPQLQDPTLEIRLLLDHLSAIDPVHADAQHLLALASETPTPDRRQRAAACLMTLLQPVRQRQGMTDCSRIVTKQATQGGEPARLLVDLRDWFIWGGITSPDDPDRQLITPPEVPQHRLKLMTLAWSGTPDELPNRAAAQALLLELRRLEGRDEAHWKGLAIAAAQGLADSDGHVQAATLQQWLEAVLCLHLQIDPQALDPACPAPSPAVQAGVEAHHRLLGACINFVAGQTDSLLLLAWQHTLDRASCEWLQQACWRAIEATVSDGAPPPHEHALALIMPALKRTFLGASTAHLDAPERVRDMRGMRLFVRVPGGSGRGVAITGAPVLGDCLARLLKEITPPGPDLLGVGACAAWLAGQFTAEGFSPDGQAADRYGDDTDPASPYCAAWWRRLTNYLWTDPYPVADARVPPALNHKALGAATAQGQIQLNRGAYLWFRDTRGHGVVSAEERSLLDLLRLMRRLNRHEHQELHDTLKAKQGRLVLASGGHVQHLLPQHPSWVGGWRDTHRSKLKWVSGHVLKPARRLLAAPVDEVQARDFADTLLRDMDLDYEDPDQHGELVDEVMRRALKRATHDGHMALRSVIAALRKVLTAVLPGHDIAEEFDVALMNHPLSQTPAVCYADPNWHDANRVLFACSPLDGRIRHYRANSEASPLDTTPRLKVIQQEDLFL